MLPKGTLVDEGVAPPRPPRGCVERVALPFIAAVAQRLERVAREQILRLGAERRALQRRRIYDVTNLDHPHGGANLHQGRDAERVTAAINDCIGVGIFEEQPAVEPFAKSRLVGKRSVGREISPDVVMAGIGAPQTGPVARGELFDSTVAALERHRPGTLCRRRIDRQSDRLSGNRMRLGGARHRFFASSLKKPLSSALAMVPAKLSNLPAVAMSRAARMTAVQPTRASVPPRLMRRTPSEARSFTVRSIALDIRKFTGFGATAFTTAAICSRVLIPGA